MGVSWSVAPASDSLGIYTSNKAIRICCCSCRYVYKNCSSRHAPLALAKIWRSKIKGRSPEFTVGSRCLLWLRGVLSSLLGAAWLVCSSEVGVSAENTEHQLQAQKRDCQGQRKNVTIFALLMDLNWTVTRKIPISNYTVDLQIDLQSDFHLGQFAD